MAKKKNDNEMISQDAEVVEKKKALKNVSKRLGKAELLELLISLSEENEILKNRNEQLEKLLEEKNDGAENADISEEKTDLKSAGPKTENPKLNSGPIDTPQADDAELSLSEKYLKFTDYSDYAKNK